MSRAQHVLTLIRSLPATPLRPAGSPQLSDALESIVNRISSSSASGAAAGEGKVVEGMIGSVERLQSGSAMSEFPLSNKTLRPAHDPLYYRRMKEGVHRSARGQGRSWWKSFFQLRGDA